MKKNIAIVAGGDSSEVVVSLKSADGLYSFIDKEIYNVFIVKSGISMDRLFSVGIGQILGIGTLLYLILW